MVGYLGYSAWLQARQKLHAAEVQPEPGLVRGDSIWLAGLNSGHAIARRRSTVISATHSVALAHPHVPRFRAVHEEVSTFRNTTLTDQALYMCCF
jgi:hypothetical protein